MPLPLEAIRSLSWDTYVHQLRLRLAAWQGRWEHRRIDLNPDLDGAWCSSLVLFRSTTRSALSNLDDEVREFLLGADPRSDGVAEPAVNTYFFGDLHAAGMVTTVLRNPGRHQHTIEILDRSRREARGLDMHPGLGDVVTPWNRILQVQYFGPAAASRLLLAERPDLYFMLNSASWDGMVAITGHSPPNQIGAANGAEHYQRMLDVIYASPWWQAERPRDALGGFIWDSRVALLDVFAYDPEAG